MSRREVGGWGRGRLAWGTRSRRLTQAAHLLKGAVDCVKCWSQTPMGLQMHGVCWWAGGGARYSSRARTQVLTHLFRNAGSCCHWLCWLCLDLQGRGQERGKTWMG
jgi:hypothetical protein